VRRPSASSYPRQVLVDTSGFFALLNRRDEHHERARTLFRQLSLSQTQLVLTNFIRAEAHGLVINRLGHHLADRFLEQLATAPGTVLLRVTEVDEERALAILARYKDKDFSFVDATSFAVMERVGLTHALAFDAHFSQYGLVVL
jgi:predicted nucleic acid-binding protein